MNDVMLDIETVGTHPGCAIISIGAVLFNLEDGELSETLPSFYTGIKLSSSLYHGLDMDPATIVWWMKQSDKAREHFINTQEHGHTLDEALLRFSKWFHFVEGQSVWGNSNRFDCGILAEAYRLLSTNIPWNGKKERDMRTYILDYPDEYQSSDIRKTNHTPIEDCLYQIKVVQQVYQNKAMINTQISQEAKIRAHNLMKLKKNYNGSI